MLLKNYFIWKIIVFIALTYKNVQVNAIADSKIDNDFNVSSSNIDNHHSRSMELPPLFSVKNEGVTQPQQQQPPEVDVAVDEDYPHERTPLRNANPDRLLILGTSNETEDTSLSENDSEYRQQQQQQQLYMSKPIWDLINNTNNASSDVMTTVETFSSNDKPAQSVLMSAVPTDALPFISDNSSDANHLAAIFPEELFDEEILKSIENPETRENQKSDEVINNDEPIGDGEIYEMPTTIMPTIFAPVTGVNIAGMVSRVKQGKQIQIQKLMPHQALRKYLEDPYIRRPIATVVDAAPVVLEEAKRIWRHAVDHKSPLDLFLLTVNETGIGLVLKVDSARTLLSAMDQIPPETNTKIKASKTFTAIIRAAELIPYDSAVFLSTDRLAADTNYAQKAAFKLLKKRARLYLLWSGPSANGPIATGGILGEVALKSGGDIVHLKERHADETEDYERQENLQTIIESENFLHDSQENSAVSQHQDQMSLTNLNSNLDAIIRAVGVGGSGIAQLETPTGDDGNYNDIESFNVVRDGPIVAGRNSHLENFRFPNETDLVSWYPEANKTNSVDMLHKTESINAVNGQVQIDLGLQSELLVRPGTTAQITFEVTNLQKTVVLFNFQVVDQQSFLRSLNPQSLWIAESQTVPVVVTVIIPANIELGVTDKITFTAQSPNRESVSQSAELRVVSLTDSQKQRDTTTPTLNYNLLTRCDSNKVEMSACSNSVWTLEITARDWETGILRIESNPRGITTFQPYIAGTNDIVKALYTASCCNPRVTIGVYDLAGNKRSATIDVRDIILTDASIAAIVLGVILLIILIAALIGLIIWCCKRGKVSRDLPTYRSRSSAERS